MPDNQRPTARDIYEIIRRDGAEELARPAPSLVWSGIVAGILISFSVLGEAILRAHLPDRPWSYLVENLGYCLGFLLVILGRMQLFTENTITTVLPLAHERSMSCLMALLRLWSIVLSMNVIGAALAAVFIVHSGIFAEGVMTAILELSRHATGFPQGEAFLRAIPAGVLIAAIVWMLAGQTGSCAGIIVIFTWLIAAGDFTHIIAGAVEMWVMIWQGELGAGQAISAFFLPVLAGNIVGGTLIFALLAWVQVRHEVEG